MISFRIPAEGFVVVVVVLVEIDKLIQRFIWKCIGRRRVKLTWEKMNRVREATLLLRFICKAIIIKPV